MKLFFGVKNPLPKVEYSKSLIIDGIKYFNEEKERGFFIEEIINNFFNEYEDLKNDNPDYTLIVETEDEMAIIYWNSKHQESIVLDKEEFDNFQLSVLVNTQLGSNPYRYFYLNTEDNSLISKNFLHSEGKEETSELSTIVYPILLDNLTLFKSKKEVVLFFTHIIIGISLLVGIFYAKNMFGDKYGKDFIASELTEFKKEQGLKSTELSKIKKELEEIEKSRNVDKAKNKAMVLNEKLLQQLKSDRFINFDNGGYR